MQVDVHVHVLIILSLFPGQTQLVNALGHLPPATAIQTVALPTMPLPPPHSHGQQECPVKAGSFPCGPPPSH